MSHAVLSLGSNLGDRAALLSDAVDSLGDSVRAVSAIYRTPPWGPVGQDDFYNIVVLAESEQFDPADWLRRCWELEQRAHRVRDIRWGPRTLDADVIDVDGMVTADPELTLPHPRAHQRAFVLLPWVEIAPDAELVGFGPIRTLIDAMPATELTGIVRLGHVG